jgi:hypothetical protein
MEDADDEPGNRYEPLLVTGMQSSVRRCKSCAAVLWGRAWYLAGFVRAKGIPTSGMPRHSSLLFFRKSMFR